MEVLLPLTGKLDLGVVQRGSENRFIWELSPESWDNVAGLTEPFCETGRTGFQWLQSAGNVRVLLSESGEW